MSRPSSLATSRSMEATLRRAWRPWPSAAQPAIAWPESAMPTSRPPYFTSAWPHAWKGTMTAPRPTASARPRHGQRFRVLRPHARGGLGAVFVALDTELTARWRSSRSSTDHADDPVSRQRFVLEAEITGGLEHPGIVPVMAWAPTLMAGPTTPCGSSAATRSRRPSSSSMPTRPRGATRAAVTGPAQAAAAVPRRLQRHRVRPQPGGAAPRHQARQRDRRQVRRDAGGRLGPGQGHRSGRTRTQGRGPSSPAQPAGSAETLPGSAWAPRPT